MKDAYYFPHDANAHQDEKILFLRFKHQWEGVGLYWTWIEMMHDDTSGKLRVDFLEGIALSLNVDITLLKQVYNTLIESALFTEKDGLYWSERVLRNKLDFENKRKQKSVAGQIGMARRWGKNNTVITDRITEITKESKVKKSKEEENGASAPSRKFVPPTPEEVKSYCAERQNRVDPEKWLAHYEANGWRVGRNPMKDWRAAVRTWEKSEFNGQTKEKSKWNDKIMDEIQAKIKAKEESKTK